MIPDDSRLPVESRNIFGACSGWPSTAFLNQLLTGVSFDYIRLGDFTGSQIDYGQENLSSKFISKPHLVFDKNVKTQ